MRLRFALLPFLMACVSDEAVDPSDASVSEAEVSGSVLEAACATTDNPLRFDCTLATESDAAVTWTVFEGSDIVRSFETQGSDHAQTLWGLPEDTELSWEARYDGGSASGTLTTGTADVGAFSISTFGVGLATDAVMVPLQCDDATGLVAFDGAGRVVWYEVLGGGSVGGKGGLQGFDTTPDGFVAGVDGTEVVEVAPDGTILRTIDGLSDPLHHDVAADEEGRLYLLEAFESDGFVVDGILVFDGTEQVGQFALSDVVTMAGGAGDDRYWQDTFPGAVDWGHANSVELVGDGTALISLKAQNAVLSVVLDPDAADFGEVVWTLTGGDSQLTSDLSWSDGGGFSDQHHASVDDDGNVLLFDNGVSSSRGLVLDVGGDSVSEVASVDVGEHCPTQGSTYRLDDGGLLVTCASSGAVLAFDAAGTEVWSASVGCGTQAPLARAMPLAW